MLDDFNKFIGSRKHLWDSLPARVKLPVGTVIALLPPQYLLGSRFRSTLNRARDIERWPLEHLRDAQLKRLREITAIAYDKTKFYREQFRSVGFHPNDLKSLSDFCRVPITERSVVSKHLQDMLSVPSRHRSAEWCSTGGTGGEPFWFYLNVDRSATEYGYLVASWERAGYKLGTPMAVLRGHPVPLDRNGLRHEYDPILRHHRYSSFHMSDENVARYLKHMASMGPCFLHVYPSSVSVMARFCRRAHIRPPGNILGIIAESEIVYPEQRKMVEEVFGCRYFSCYGHSEKLVLAAECEHSTDYHVWPTYGYFELLDEQGRSVTTPGQRGEIVGTGFINTVMPFIRYRTGDWATYVGARCEACGREHVIVRDIRGHRTQEVLIAADGSDIPWTALNMHDDTFLHVRQFQFMQDTPGRAVLKIVPAEGFGSEDGERIRRNLGRKLEGRLTFTLERVNEIPLTARGKAIYVDQRISTNTCPNAHGV